MRWYCRPLLPGPRRGSRLRESFPREHGADFGKTSCKINLQRISKQNSCGRIMQKMWIFPTFWLKNGAVRNRNCSIYSYLYRGNFSQIAATVALTSSWVPSKSFAVRATQCAICFISASPRPRVVTAAVPIRTPLVTEGF